MCVGFDAFYTHIDVNVPVINMYHIQEHIISTFNAQSGNGDRDVPAIDMEDLTTAEQAMINCTITLRNGPMADAYDGIHDANRDLIIQHGAPGDLGTHHKDVMNSTETVELNRNNNMKYAQDMYPNDSAAQEKKLYLKILAETYAHEMCHSAGHDHSGGETGQIYTTGYYTTAMGRCERDAFEDTFQEKPPSYKKVFGQSQNYSWNVTCMSSINANNADYFNSLHSGASASRTYPTYPVDYIEFENPYY